MPPPKRPFNTSSLTSSLKSTFANQPLLSNLTNLDKLTEHATNLAHKAPFFDALNEQFQQARAQDINARQAQPPPATDATKPPTFKGANTSLTMNTLANSKPVQNVPASNVDMSHLSEHERLMIQSVMAKAEMSEIGPNTNSTIPNSMNMNQLSQMNQPMLHQQQNQRTQPTSMMSQPFQQSQMRQGPVQNSAPFQQMPMQMATQPMQQQQLNQQQPIYNQNLSVNQQLGYSQPMNMTPGMSGLPGSQQTVSNHSAIRNNNQSFDQNNLNQANVIHQTNQPNQQQGFIQIPSNPLRAQQQNLNLAANNQSALTNPISLPQQNLWYQTQMQSPYGQLIQQQEAQAINQQQILGPSQRAEPVQQRSLLGISSNQIPMQSQDNSATFMQPLNVIDQSNLNNQIEAPFQHQQQMLFCDKNNLAGNIVTPINHNLNMNNQQLVPLHNQQSFPNIYPQPESILRNREGREGIRFRSDTFREDYAVSDHDTYDDQRRLRSSRRRDDRSLRRYNSMESSSRIRQSSRERSRDLRGTHENTAPGAIAGLTRQRQLPKLAELGRQPVQHKSTMESPVQLSRDSRKLRSTPTMRRSARFRRDDRADSLSLSTDSDQDDASIASSVMSEERIRAQRIVDGKRSSPKLQRPSKSAGSELNDESIKRLDELKITDQASQVMEQQQLLIQQSQELIKLQQAQLEQHSKNKETEMTRNQADQLIRQTDHSGSNIAPQSVVASHLRDSSNSNMRSVVGTSQETPAEIRVVRNASNQTSQLKDPTPRSQISKATSVDSIDLINIENDANDLDSKNSRLTNQSDLLRKIKPTSMGLTGLERVSIPRYSLNLLKSPSETTDSDGEMIQKRSSSRRRHRGLQSAQSNQHGRVSAIHRREPMGLPPSPLPVSAAIQLHQLQQKHSRDESDSSTRWAKNRREAYSRSKSVCNSPNHLLPNGNFSRSIDEGRHLYSPDAASAFGLRRKRLPEPPSHSMPLTPSMVRKMIDAQKAAATSSNKLLTSVNAQSTLLTNMHTYRNPCFDRAPNESLRQALNSRSISKYIPTTSYARRSVGSCGTQVSFVDPKNPYRASSDRENDLRRIEDRYTKLNYANSILKGSRYQDLFSAPTMAREFERRITEQDHRYGSDSRYQFENYNTTPIRRDGFSNHGNSSVGNRASNLGTTNFSTSTLTSSYVPKPSCQSDSTRNLYNSYRRNSEGESALQSRINRLPLHDVPNYSYLGESSNAVLSDRARDQSYRLSHSALLSPVKRYSRFQATNEHYPESRYDLSSREITNSTNRHLSHWPASYLDSVAYPKMRHFGMSLEGVDSNRLDANRWTAGSLGRYANFQTSRHSDLDRHVLRDQTTRRNDWYADRTGANRSMMRYSTRQMCKRRARTLDRRGQSKQKSVDQVFQLDSSMGFIENQLSRTLWRSYNFECNISREKPWRYG